MRTLLALVIAACSGPAHPPATASAPPAPDGCRWVAAGDALRAEAAVPGARLCLAAGRHAGPIAVAAGTVIELAAGAALIGATVDGRGGVFDRTDAGVKIAGDGARVEGATIVHA